jgi:hypothetical protein
MANWLNKLQKMEGAVVGNYNPHSRVIRTPSPSVNFTFGNGYGLPLGFTLALGGPPKGGKSVLCNSAIGQLHKDDPEAFAVKFDTEFREQGQLTEQQTALWGIDKDRYIAYSVNSPESVFDRIEQEISALCQEGMPLKLVVIDSITGIQGRRAMNADSISVQQIGDLALTLQEGFKRILPVQRKHKFAIILTCHIRAEMDLLEQKRGNKVKMALPFGVQHYAEYFMFVEPNRNKEGRTDLAGREFKNEELGDVADNAEQTGHKIKVKMKDSSCGPKGRVGEFTLDYHRGIINTHEEAFLLGKNRGVFEMPTQAQYVFAGEKWIGKDNLLEALHQRPELRKAVLDEVFRRDSNENEPEAAAA